MVYVLHPGYVFLLSSGAVVDVCGADQGTYRHREQIGIDRLLVLDINRLLLTGTNRLLIWGKVVCRRIEAILGEMKRV